MVFRNPGNLSRGAARAFRAALLGLLLLLVACPAQVAWEEGQRNVCKRRRSLARRCWSYALVSNIQCQQEEKEARDRSLLGDTSKVEPSPIRLTDLTCDRELLVTYVYCDSLIPAACRIPDRSNSSSGSGESSGSGSSNSRSAASGQKNGARTNAGASAQ